MDLEEWVRHLIILNYADDTSTSHSWENLDTVVKNLEEDTTSFLQFMASNGLVANPSKTEFMILNSKDNENPRRIRVGNSVVEKVKRAKTIRNDNGQRSEMEEPLLGEERTFKCIESETVCNKTDS